MIEAYFCSAPDASKGAFHPIGGDQQRRYPDGTYQPGYTTRSLPRGYRTETISGRNYYYHNGAYFLRDSNGYVVTEAPRQSRYYTEYTRYR